MPARSCKSGTAVGTRTFLHWGLVCLAEEECRSNQQLLTALHVICNYLPVSWSAGYSRFGVQIRSG